MRATSSDHVVFRVWTWGASMDFCSFQCTSSIFDGGHPWLEHHGDHRPNKAGSWETRLGNERSLSKNIIQRLGIIWKHEEKHQDPNSESIYFNISLLIFLLDTFGRLWAKQCKELKADSSDSCVAKQLFSQHLSCISSAKAVSQGLISAYK